VLRVLIVAHVGAVEHVHHLTVDAARDELVLAPDFLALGRGAFDQPDFAGLLAEHVQAGLADVQRGLLHRPTLAGDPQFRRQSGQLERVADPVALGLAFGDRQQSEGQIPSVVGVG